jgi:DNA-directed RNA polymerase subunit E'/Rpb7
MANQYGEIITIEKSICLDPSDLDKNLKKVLTQKMIQEIGKCDKNVGYILGLDGDITIISNIVSSANCDIFFTVKASVNTLLPKIGAVYSGIADKVFTHGIFVLVMGTLKVLIPANSLAEYIFQDGDTPMFISKNSKGKKKTIKFGDTIFTTIQMVKYDKEFKCTGNLKTD